MAYEELFDKMARGPAFLFLGQDYLRLETGKDPFLAEVIRKYGKPGQAADDYNILLDLIPATTTETALAWMQNRCAHLPYPRWLESIAAFAWNGIYTSAIDIIWPQSFQSKWRVVEPIMEERQNPIDPRNRSKLHSTFLFGRVDQAEEAKRPPLLYEEWLTRKPIAMSLARRLPELITPVGIFIIEGYAGERDWFHPDDLFPILNACNPGQVYIFSATEQLLEHRTLSALYRSGKLIPFEESLASVLTRGIEADALVLGMPSEEEAGKSLKIADRYVTIPPTIWTRVSASAIILDDEKLLSSSILSPEKRYDAFRQFLSQASMKPQWSGYEAGFAFTRPFEQTLYEEVSKRLRLRDQQTHPVLVHGQTGTGKTVALGALAHKIRKEQKHPVLFIERQTQRPIDFFSDIDVFCEWAENHGATSTLVVWDGMVEPDYYSSLLQYLAGRGRKVILVGSCYLITGAASLKKRGSFVEAKADIAAEEQQYLIEYLEGIDPTFKPLSSLVKRYGNTSFLVALYRLLPPTRSQLRQGLDEEVQFTEEEIRRKASNLHIEPEVGALAFALLKARLISEQQLLLASENKTIDGEQVDELRELIGLVMVPGRFGLKVPIELLLRALGKQTILHFVSLLKGIDLFRWDEDAVGNIAIGPRHPLEAKLVAQAYLGRAETEIEYARRLLIEIRDQNIFLDNSEIQFAVDLVRSMGPNSELDAGYFAPHFPTLSSVLRDLREQRGVQHPRLMLQEATLLREAVKWQNYDKSNQIDIISLLDKSEQVLHQAVNLLQGDRKNSRLRSVLLVELAATLGMKMQHYLKDASHRQASLQLFEETSKHLFKVMALDSKDYHPIDVLAWTTRDLLYSHLLDNIPSTRAEIEADILHAFEIAESEDLNPVLLNTRKWEIGQAIGNVTLSEEAFAALLAQGSCAGLYLRAKQMAHTLPSNRELTSTECTQCEQAAQYLEEQRSLIVHDGRCLHLLLTLWWMSQTGKPIFSSFERQTISFTPQQWQYCLTLMKDLMALEDLYTTPRLRYLEGLATFHLGRIRESFQIFRELERTSENQGRRRVIRSYLASNEQGRPRTFDGIVEQVEGNKGILYVGTLREKVPFFVKDFNRPNIQRGESLHGFHLAFNFIGPIADPENFFEIQQRREG